MTSDALDEVWDDWKDAVSMTASELERWLDTDESKSVGQKKEGGEDEKGETETEGPDAKGGPQSVGKYAAITPAGKLTNVVVTGYPKGNVEFRDTKGSRVIIECSNKFTGQIGAKTMAQLDDNLEAVNLVLPPEDIAALDEVSAERMQYPHWMVKRNNATRVPTSEPVKMAATLPTI